MRRFAHAAALFACLIWLSACSAALEPIVPTPRPTRTPLPTSTPTPTPLVSPTPSPTLRPTLPPDISPTPLLGFVPTRPAEMPTATVQTLPISLLRIEYFTADVTAAAAGDVITLYWAVQGADIATIYRLEGDREPFERGQAWRVPRNGSLRVAVRPNSDGLARFSLVVSNGVEEIAQELRITASCTEAWFFEPVPSDAGCPTAPAVPSLAVYQPFERGMMFWIAEGRTIYALFSDNRSPAWLSVADEYRDGQPESDPSLSPPEGLQQPVRGFGLAWRSRDNLRRRLGWATAPEVAFETQFQQGENVLFLRDRDGKIIGLYGTGERWR
ncbi:MAG: hypothetical protein RML95_12465 [Anaerolineae bacterium]|nr:hypothetical protein [Anaerolineae bacterium]MDW8300138.1 hypothetical protein [Anaerolineae bacterium]